MKTFSTMLCSAAFAASAFGAATVSDVTLKQLWPFSSDVKVDYTLSGVSDMAAIKVEFFNGDEPLAADFRIGKNIRGDFAWAENGTRSFTFDPKSVFAASGVRALSALRVKISADDAGSTKAKDVIYKIVDLANGSIDDVTRADLLNGKYGSVETNYNAFSSRIVPNLDDVIVWTGVTNGSLYRTSKLVLRRIPAKAYGEWTMGEDRTDEKGVKYCSNASAHKVQLNQDYWIGVFPLTQGQSKYIVNGYGSYFTADSVDYGDHNLIPHMGMHWNTARDSKGTDLAHTWPADRSREVDEKSVMGLLRSKTGNVMKFDLPTETQWEFACRAGTTTLTYLGDDGDFLSASSWGQARVSLGYDYKAPRMVGLLTPNAFGLYDMLGLVREWCLDLYNGDYVWTDTPETDPVGPTVSSTTDAPSRVARGRVFSSWGNYSAWRDSAKVNTMGSYTGVRICCTIEE